MTARTAFAAGYAQVGVLPAPRWVHAACAAAAAVSPTDLTVVEAVGRLEGRRAALQRRREQIYATHRPVVMSCAARLVAAVHLDDLTVAVLTALTLPADGTADTDRHRRRGAAKAAALAILTRTLVMSDGLAADWQTANATAYADATAEGQAQAAASPDAGGPADPRAVPAMLAAGGIATAAAWQTADEWTGAQLAGLAGDVATVALGASPETLRAAIATALSDRNGVAYYLDDQIHAAAVGGFLLYLDPATDTVEYVCVGDSHTCPTCIDFAFGSPYQPDEAPEPPVHGTCRCWLETSSPTRSSTSTGALTSV